MASIKSDLIQKYKALMKDKASHSNPEILRQKAEEIQKKKPIVIDTLCLQGETLKLIHELDVHQIELEMQNEELKLAKEQVEMTAEKYVDLYDFAPSGYFTLSKNGEILKANFKGANILGKERAFLINNRFGLFVDDESKSILNSFLDRIFKSQNKETCEITLSTQPEKTTYLLLNGIAINGNCLITAIDISKLKKAEIALKKSELLLYSSIDSQKDTLIFSIDTDYRYLTYNKIHSDLMKNSYNSVIKTGMNILDCITVDEDRKFAKQNIDIALKGESHSSIRTYGAIESAYYESFYNPIISNNKIIGASVLARNITKRLQIEEAIKESEEKYRALFDSNRDSITIFRLNPEGIAENFIEANAASTEIYGYTKEELMKMNVRDLEPITQKTRKQRIKTLLANGRLNLETTIKTKNGKSRNVEIEVFFINFLNKPAVMSITRDITELKQIELNAKKAQENLLTILEAIPDLLFEVNQDGLIHHYQSHQHFDLYTIPEEVFMGKRFQDVLPADAANICMDALEEASKKGWSSGKEYALDLPMGKLWFELSVSTIRESDLKDKHFIVLARDITERKIAEEKLIANENFLKQTQIIANLGSYSLDFASGKWTSTAILDSIFGIDADFERTADGWESLLHPEWKKIMHDYLHEEIIGKRNSFNKEYKIIKSDSKEERWLHGMGELTFDKEGQPIRLIGSIQDITERKQNEKKIHESEQFARAVFDALSAHIAIIDENGIILSVNLAWRKFMESNTPEGIPITISEGSNYLSVCKTSEGLYADEASAMISGIRSVMNGENNEFSLEYPCHSPTERRWFNVRVTRFPQEGDSRIVVAHENITERKKIEEKLKLSSEKFQDLVNSTGGIVWEADAVTFNFTYVSKEAVRLFGFPEQEWYTEGFWENHIHPEDKEKAVKKCVSSTKEMKSHDFTYRFIAKNGKAFWLRDIVNVIVENGKPRWLRGVMFDITGLKENEESLRESEEKYRGLVENFPDAVVIYIDGKIVFINEEGIRMVGAKNKEELIGKSVLEFVHPDSLESIIKRMEEVALDSNSSETVEEKFINLEGNPIDAEIKAIPTIYDHQPAIQVIIHDISSRKQASLELNKINRVYALISQINNLIIRTTNREELFQEICNIAVTFGKFRMSWIGLLNEHNQIVTAAIAGYENGYFSKRSISALEDKPGGKGPTGIAMREARTVICNNIAKDSIMELWRDAALERGYHSSISIPITVRNKTIGIFNLYSDEKNFFSSEEEISLLEKIIQNISFALEAILIEEDRKRTEEKIRQLSQAVEQSPVTIVITNTKGEIEYANPKFIETTGYSLEEIMNQNPRILKSGYTSNEEYGELWQTLATGKEWHGEFHNRKKDGTLYWESATISPILNENGETTHYIAIKEDITSRKNVEKELVKSKERAEESDRLKLAFLANMSHEIRTPMNGILGFTELLKEPKLTGEEQQQYIEIIEKSGKRMLNIINDIISISKVESGQIEIVLSETNINEQLKYIHTFFKPEAKQKGIQLILSKELPLEQSFTLTDKEKVYAILTNLVKNAIKFTNEGTIEFGCERKGKNLEFFVKDSGLGISKSQKKIIFERFRQANETISRSHEGSGLGLAISKAYVEMLGGKIGVQSEKGKGSTFYFTLPFQSKHEYNPKHAIDVEKTDLVNTKDLNSVKDLKILIVEDDAISKLLVTIAVKPFSKEILKVSTGHEAIEACRNNPDIDLVMMDINMPEMGGYEATKQIREFNKDIIIIAQTANGMQGDRENALAAGCTDYISKPINITSLSELIKTYFKK